MKNIGLMRKLLTEGTVFVAGGSAVLFLMGRSYQTGYFAFYGFDLTALDQPVYVALTWSITPLVEGYRWFIESGLGIAFLLVLVVFWLSRYTFPGRVITARILKDMDFSDSKLWIGILSFIFIPLCLLFLIAGSYSLGKRAAAKNYRCPDEAVTLTIKKDGLESFSQQLLTANANGTLMLLAQSKDFVVTFVKIEAAKPRENGVFVIPLASLLAVNIRDTPPEKKSKKAKIECVPER